MPEYVNLLDKITEGRKLPRGYDAWAIKTVRPDLRTKHGYRWPYPGRIARAEGPFLDHRGSCPQSPGDGICIATTWAGMASAGVAAITLLLVAYKTTDVIGDSETDKMRVKAAKVVELIDGADLLRASGHGADLYGANLHGANLHGADLHGADLSGADLHGADLSGANLPSVKPVGIRLLNGFVWPADGGVA